jgi:hypothetical protein
MSFSGVKGHGPAVVLPPKNSFVDSLQRNINVSYFKTKGGEEGDREATRVLQEYAEKRTAVGKLATHTHFFFGEKTKPTDGLGSSASSSTLKLAVRNAEGEIYIFTISASKDENGNNRLVVTRSDGQLTITLKADTSQARGSMALVNGQPANQHVAGVSIPALLKLNALFGPLTSNQRLTHHTSVSKAIPEKELTEVQKSLDKPSSEKKRPSVLSEPQLPVEMVGQGTLKGDAAHENTLEGSTKNVDKKDEQGSVTDSKPRQPRRKSSKKLPVFGLTPEEKSPRRSKTPPLLDPSNHDPVKFWLKQRGFDPSNPHFSDDEEDLTSMERKRIADWLKQKGFEKLSDDDFPGSDQRAVRNWLKRKGFEPTTFLESETEDRDSLTSVKSWLEKEVDFPEGVEMPDVESPVLSPKQQAPIKHWLRRKGYPPLSAKAKQEPVAVPIANWLKRRGFPLAANMESQKDNLSEDKSNMLEETKPIPSWMKSKGYQPTEGFKQEVDD